MSMLSAQCDELRERAKTLRQGRWSDGADDARLMEDAADTIKGLESENAKLRSELESVGTASYLYGRSDLKAENAKLCGQYEAVIDDYRSEVAKLRELCGYLLPFARTCGAEHPLMRELGIEVDE